MSTVSFVTTVYNKARFLPHVTAALAMQRGNFDREFIFVNDGSTDDSLRVLYRLTSEWPNLRIIDQGNAGPSDAFNTGLSQATGDFIKPLDGDDVLAPWATRRLIEALLTSGCHVAYAPEGQSYDVALSPQQIMSGLRERKRKVERHDDMLQRSLRRAQTNPAAWLARADLVRRIGGCDPRVFIQDYSIELRLAKEGGFAHLDEPIFLSPLTSEGRLSNNKAQTLHDVNLALAYFLRDYTDIPLKQRRYAFTRASGRAWAWARRHARKGLLSAEFLRYLGARTRIVPPSFENCRAACNIFAETDKIRFMPRSADIRRRLSSHAVSGGGKTQLIS